MLAKHCGTCDDSPEESDKKVHRKREEPKDEPTASSKGVVLTYNWLLFPIVAGFLLVLLISSFLQNYRLFYGSDVSEGFATLNSAAMLFVFALIGVVFAIEIFGVEPYGGFS